MTYTVESKNQLAKLLATENLTIEHRKVPTASFDIKNRILTCPIWKDMSGELYDLVMGHEVGHALETPFEGWHNSVCARGINYKHFLNVVEDARIEKKITRRYPGLKRSFVIAYNRLMEDNFFGVLGQDMNRLFLIDRINLHFKCGIKMKIRFNDTEMEYVKQIESCETWDDVVEITDKLFVYCEGEQRKKQEDDGYNQLDQELNSEEFEFDGSSESDSVEESESDSGEESESDSGEESDGKDGEESESDSGEESDGKDGEESESDEESDEKEVVINHDKESVESEENQFEPECVTDKHFRKNELTLVDEKCLPYIYVNIPKPNLSKIITPQKRVHEILNDAFRHDNRKKNMQEFKHKNDNYIGLLAKEFEMRKSASRYAKRKISTSGDIDVNKIYKYQLEDSIFRKITKVPNGKSHGIILLLDCSGSMSANIDGAIEQIMVLAMFCRRVNIPFVVYGFGNNAAGWAADYPNQRGLPRRSFSSEIGEMFFENVSLREYLNSEMGNGEFTNALSNLATLKTKFASRNFIPISEHLSNTPLTQAIVALRPIVEDFRKKHKLDILNLAVVHDGDADYCTKHRKDNSPGVFTMDPRTANYIICDKERKNYEKYDYTSYSSNGVRIAIFNWFTKVTGVKIFGFFIVPDSSYKIREAIMNHYYIDGKKFIDYHAKNRNVGIWSVRNMDVTVEHMKKFRNTKLFTSETPGYKKFFLILGGKSLITDYDDLDVEEGASVRKLKSAFTKKYNSRKINRVLVNQFIEGIAA